MTMIPLWAHLLIYLLGLGGGVLDAKRLRRKAGGELDLDDVLKKAPYLYVALPLVLLPLVYGWGLSQYPRMEWHVPLWMGYWMGPLIWGIVLSIFMYLSGVMIAVAFASGHVERWKLPIVAVLLALTVEYGHWHFTRVLEIPSNVHQVKGPVVMQTTPVSCAAASAATILRAWGRKQSTEREMVQRFRTNAVFGTGDAHVVYGLAGLGVSCQRREWTLAELSKQKPPQMIFVKTTKRKKQEDHAVVFAGMRSGRVVIWDPLIGEDVREKKDFLDFWQGRGLLCQRPTWAK